ncbi:MAG: TRAP transporter small permease subunit [Geminicoccaceae bacterium]|nr:MAG: TRAP transporter small permease subunit [Geminicoccaceae bacterium]
MGLVHGARRALEFGLIVISLLLMTSLAVLVVAAVGFRSAGASLTWYDEVASVMLAWITYYGAALAALRRAHLGFPNLVAALPRSLRLLALAISETAIITFFALAAYFGLQVLDLLRGDTLISLPWVRVEFTQSVIPIGAALFIVAELFTIPDKVQEILSNKAPGELGHGVDASPR